MSRVSQVIADARSIIADPSAQRWDNTLIMRYYNQCIKDIVIQTKSLHAKAFIQLEANINTYILPDVSLCINRVQYLDTALPIKTHQQMDKMHPLWETHTGDTVKYAIVDLTDGTTFKVYPRVTDTTMDYITANSNYGIIIDIETFDDVFNLPNIADVNNIPKYLVVYYTQLPNEILETTPDADLQFSYIWDTAISHYIAGRCLRSDEDQQNRAFGAEELQIYANDIIRLLQNEEQNNTLDSYGEIAYKGFI